MDSIYRYVLESSASGKLDKQTAIDLLKLLGKEGKASRDDIAIIGMAFKLPQAETVDEFRANIANNAELIREFPESRSRDAANYLRYIDSPMKDNGFLKLAYLEEIDKFDYSFFKISPKEASLMDPNQRIFLETAWKAIEEAGYSGEKIKSSKTGIYLGFRSDHFYDYRNCIAEVEPSSIMRAYPSNMTAVIASRLSYILDLKGPSILIDTSCSSSLVAVHYACKGLINHECEMAIAGGIKVNILPLEIKEKLGIESSEGAVKTFDNSSDGAVMGEGSIAILLKPLSKALKDRDHIYAVIKGSAVNHDGNSIGIAAPNAAAHEGVIAQAWEDARVNPETISYIEAHGTGTKLGDPIEVDGIQRAFRRYTNKRQFCAIASVKAWMGHLDNAAGIAGLINAVIALNYQELPYVRQFKRPNKNIRFHHSPVYVSARPGKWERGDHPRRCGVSSFGMSGTNCHVVLEEIKEEKGSANTLEYYPQIFTVSAKTRNALVQILKQYGTMLAKADSLHISDVCYTANTGRMHHENRLAVIISSPEDFKEKVERLNTDWENAIKEKDIFYNSYTIVQNNIEAKEAGEITEHEIKKLSHAAAAKIKEFIASGKKDQDILEHVSKLYTAGANIDWESMYEGEKPKKVSLPTYPFEGKRCWLDIPVMQEKNDADSIFYDLVWSNCELEQEDLEERQGAVLLIKDAAGLGDQLADQLLSEGRKVVEVELGDTYGKIDNGHYTIGSCLHDYGLLIDEIDKQGINLSQIVHLPSVSRKKAAADVCDLEGRLQTGVISLFNLTKALAGSGMKDKLDLLLVSEQVNEVTGRETGISPENAALFGLGMDIRWEHPHLCCRCMDMDETVGAAEIMSELKNKSFVYKAAYREGKRYTETLDFKNMRASQDEPLQIKEGGTYMITGGIGGIGLKMAASLAEKNKVNIVFINRTPLPARSDWENVLKENKDLKVCHILQAINKIELIGSRVFCIHADVSKGEQMQKAFDEIRKNIGEVNGIIHAAGVRGTGSIEQTTEQAFMDVLAPKVKGTFILDRLTQKSPLDFFVMCSSVATLIGEYGNTGYTSANAYMDSFSSYRKRAGGKTLAIRWSTWEQKGMVDTAKVNESRLLFRLMRPEDAINAFETALSKNIHSVVIGRLNFNAPIFAIRDFMPFTLAGEVDEILAEKAKALKTTAGKSTAGAVLKGRQDGNYTEIETQVAGIWKEILGYQEIDIHSNFFEIGGDSISIAKIHAGIEELYPGKVTITDLFAYPTIHKLSQYLSKGMGLSTRPPLAQAKHERIEDDIESLINALEDGGISIDAAINSFNDIGEV